MDGTGKGELMDAWAVLDETEEVGGPEENIDRFGVLKRDGCVIGGVGLVVVCTGIARSSSGAELVWYLEGGRGEKMELSVGSGEVAA